MKKNKINNKINNIISNDKKIKYPFDGQAPNLIDKFLVLGYNQKTIEFTYKNCNIESYLNTRFTFFKFEERPYIINEICNDYSKDSLDNDLILKLIFPNYPQMHFLEKEFINRNKEIYYENLISPYDIYFMFYKNIKLMKK